MFDFEVDVLKVAHHGSKTSTDSKFIEKLSPEVALISVGENNRYGHPNEEVIETLRSYDVEIYRTDLHGAVRYIFKTDSGGFHTYLPN